jgi:hypothetical protein
MNNTSKLFILTCERYSCILWFVNKLKLTYLRLTGFMASFNFILIVLVPWDRFSLCHTPIRPLSAFQDQISILIVGYVTIWSCGLHHLVSEKGFENRSYPLEICIFLVFIKFLFPVFASIFFFFLFFFISMTY